MKYENTNKLNEVKNQKREYKKQLEHHQKVFDTAPENSPLKEIHGKKAQEFKDRIDELNFEINGIEELAQTEQELYLDTEEINDNLNEAITDIAPPVALSIIANINLSMNRLTKYNEHMETHKFAGDLTDEQNQEWDKSQTPEITRKKMIKANLEAFQERQHELLNSFAKTFQNAADKIKDMDDSQGVVKYSDKDFEALFEAMKNMRNDLVKNMNNNVKSIKNLIRDEEIDMTDGVSLQESNSVIASEIKDNFTELTEAIKKFRKRENGEMVQKTSSTIKGR